MLNDVSKILKQPLHLSGSLDIRSPTVYGKVLISFGEIEICEVYPTKYASFYEEGINLPESILLLALLK